MISKYRFFLITAISFFIAIFFITQTPLSASKGTESSKKGYDIVVWHTLSSYNKDIFRQIADSFSDKNPNIRIKQVFYGNDKDIVLNLVKKDTLPDIVIISTQYLNDLANKNMLINMGKYISKSLYTDIDEDFWAPVRVQETIYGMPYMYDPLVVYVNQNLLWNSGLRDYKEPTDWSGIVKYAKRVKYLNSKKWGIFVPIENIEDFCSFVETYSRESVIKNGRFIINSAGAVSAMSFLQNAVYKLKIMPSKTTLNEVQASFLSGNLAIMLANSSSFVYLTSNFPYNLDLWKVPATEKSKPYIKTNCLAIVKKNTGSHYREAYDFILYLINKENSIKWFTHTGIPPLRNSIKSSLELLIFYENNPNYSVPMLELNRDRIFPNIDHYDEINAIVKNAVEKIMIKGENPEDVLNSAQNKIDSLQ